jgi:hypothetical protein
MIKLLHGICEIVVQMSVYILYIYDGYICIRVARRKYTESLFDNVGIYYTNIIKK